MTLPTGNQFLSGKLVLAFIGSVVTCKAAPKSRFEVIEQECLRQAQGDLNSSLPAGTNCIAIHFYFYATTMQIAPLILSAVLIVAVAAGIVIDHFTT
jgi:hypothetical protein